MAKAARDHAADGKKNGIVAHIGSDGSTTIDRIKRYGGKNGGENIDFGTKSALEVIIALLVDDGVSSRGHRRNMFAPNKKVGIATDGHLRFGQHTVIDYSR